MLANSLKKLSQSTAVAVLGVAALAVVGTAPANAANLQKFNLSGTFSSNATYEGFYEVDVDQLPTQTNVPLNDWNVALKDNTGSTFATFSNSPGQLGTIFGSDLQVTLAGNLQNVLLFFDLNAPQKQLVLQTANNFTGTGPITVGTYINQTGTGLSVASGGSTAVPEPITLTGTAVAGAMGLWMKRKQKASKAA